MGFMLEKYEVVYSLRIAEVSHYLLCAGFTYPIHHRTSLSDSIFTVNKRQFWVGKKCRYFAKDCVSKVLNKQETELLTIKTVYNKITVKFHSCFKITSLLTSIFYFSRSLFTFHQIVENKKCQISANIRKQNEYSYRI